MRSASRSPASYETPGIDAESANATPSKVLWLSLRTMTFHGRPSPEPSPRSSRSRGGASVVSRDRAVHGPAVARLHREGRADEAVALGLREEIRELVRAGSGSMSTTISTSASTTA